MLARIQRSDRDFVMCSDRRGDRYSVQRWITQNFVEASRKRHVPIATTRNLQPCRHGIDNRMQPCFGQLRKGACQVHAPVAEADNTDVDHSVGLLLLAKKWRAHALGFFPWSFSVAD